MKPYPEPVAGLRVEKIDGTLRITIDRIERRNSITDAMVRTLTDLFEASASDESVRVVHLCAEGPDFCTGFDLRERASTGDHRPRVSSIQRRMEAHVNELIPAMLQSQTPIVCSAQGWVIGLGLALALAADFTVLADDARLWAPFTTFGFTPDSGISWLLPRMAGLARAKDMLMLGTTVSGADAAAWGLVHGSCETHQLTAETDALVARLATGPTVALGLTKLLMHRGLTTDIDRHLTEEGWAMEVSSRSEDFKEYGRATADRREPEFKGR